MESEVSVTDLVRGVVAGDLRALARAATLVENQTSAGRELLASLASRTGRAMIAGITGPSGAGKSTLTNRLAALARREGLTVGVLAIDPSSPYSHGAILGDRIRMQDHSGDPGVFIRSLASRGAPGGIARATLDLARLLDAAGRDLILIETVGAGQDEVAIAGLADVTVVVLVPGLGDDVQASKAGMMEIADIFAINKADLPGASSLEQELRAAGIAVPIRQVVATEDKGCDELFRNIREIYGRSSLPAGRGSVEGLRRLRNPERQRGACIEIEHIGIAVRSLEEALPFYERSLGMRVSHCETIDAERVRVAMLPTGDATIELLEATGADSPIARFIEKRGPGLHHVALRVDDLEAAVERLKRDGARLLNEPRTGADGYRYVFVHPASAGGVLLELIQNPER